ncbi:hypothetical protein F4779DRAFT_49148 [Xylariaceae sp. FL0662B]|nr:hypothetical protein F4779DRAFT_49148 [Xylariaceae sp. FL0662B]
MKTTTLFWGLVALRTITGGAAMHITHMPAMTAMLRSEPTSVVSSDPWECVTENVTQYFDVPKPTGSLLDAIVSYGDKLIEPCVATATGIEVLDCSVTDTKEWCGFTTAAPSSILVDYSSYGSSVASFWEAKSETISVVSSTCPGWWARPGQGDHIWLNLTIAQAECYIAAHANHAALTTTSSATAPVPTTDTASSTATGPTPTSNGVLGRALSVRTLILAIIGLIVATKDAWYLE